MEHAINGLNMGKECIPEALSLGCPFDQASNVGDLKISWVHGPEKFVNIGAI